MSESASSTQHAGSNNAEQQGAQKASFELPEENTKTALKQNDRTHVVDLVTGQTVTEPIARNRQTDNLVIVCVDPNKKHGQAEAAIRVAKRLVKPGDYLIFMTVLPLQVLSETALGAFGATFDIDYQVETLKRMRKDTVDALAKLFKDEFPEGIHAYARVVHGGAERQILLAAEETNCSLIILGKRKMGMWQKLVTPSVSNWIVSKAPCDVLIAK